MSRHRYHVFDTAHGPCGLAWNDAGITRLQLPARDAQSTERDLLRRLPDDAAAATATAAIADTMAAIQRYFAGEEVAFDGVTLDLAAQSDLFRQIYAAARRIGWGRTTTYGALAKELGGDWEMAREVGQAMAKNPVALIIPCHRVLAAGNKVGGFSAPGGATAKRKMLALEGVHLGAPQTAQGSLEL
jgi:methylated-DNA-[protein]-cysteine S-methyltransferase